ncbi:hypothetical protein [Streptomyces varsoviensis]|uniref:Uncharacterized protein n=1 Tax=Streptomyces varsoviensis TaxID=67373 RepID=A0ABR5IZQ5_9ACTN|nr:hypothetical protein [Streptomyces varsoviensis]KOG86615.1 hypothetical protein ADK38_30025 [Streptomyces varsoviensis]
MSLTTEGRAPGPVRFYLACDRGGCTERVTFDLVISEPPPDEELDLTNFLLHEAKQAVPYIAELGWIFLQGGEGYWCPACSTPSRGPAAGAS